MKLFPKLDDWGRSKIKQLRTILTCWGVFAFLVTVVVVVIGAFQHPMQNWVSVAARFLFLVWALVPPLWFILEWHYWEPDSKDTSDRKSQFDDFKYSQDLARYVWAAALVLLVTLLLKRP